MVMFEKSDGFGLSCGSHLDKHRLQLDPGPIIAEMRFSKTSHGYFVIKNTPANEASKTQRNTDTARQTDRRTVRQTCRQMKQTSELNNK